MPEDREELRENASPDDRRQHRRFPVKLRVLFERSGVANLIEAETEDIGLGGVFIKTNRRPLEPGTPVSILIQHDGGELMISGTVRWISDETRAQTHQGERGMGVQFDDLGEDKLRALRALIDARAALAP